MNSNISSRIFFSEFIHMISSVLKYISILENYVFLISLDHPKVKAHTQNNLIYFFSSFLYFSFNKIQYLLFIIFTLNNKDVYFFKISKISLQFMKNLLLLNLFEKFNRYEEFVVACKLLLNAFSLKVF